ncbi:hypothetical protein SLEP1_g28936 [Rubroshorea leprosula]|uniref:Uncharacterized protein n=1 Tax=Rubroshorea leprosula TaxID=152421 RepID=A0AAV5K0Z7_9ROSI|nr:hypothetical protein SLEP1_g28936 [Rubroshorea leprosula]
MDTIAKISSLASIEASQYTLSHNALLYSIAMHPLLQSKFKAALASLTWPSTFHVCWLATNLTEYGT